MKLIVWAAAFLISAFGVVQLVLATDEDDTSKMALVGVDGSGNSIVKMVDAEVFKTAMSKAVTTVQDSFQTALDLNAKTMSQPCLELQTIGVGIAITGNLSLEPVVSLSATPHLRLIFTNSPSPVYPD